MEDSLAQRALAMFWSSGVDSLNGLYEFDVCKRIHDEWYASVIDECRAGHLHPENYSLLHGYPTLCCGSWITRTQKLQCGSEACFKVMHELWPQMRQGKSTWDVAQLMECKFCQAERLRRRRVLDEGATNINPDFAVAPLITP